MPKTVNKELIRHKLWNQEIQKRKNFGISDEFFINNGFIKLYYCSLKYFRDFALLYSMYVSYKNPKHYGNLEARKLLMDSFIKYKSYTFNQLKEAGGALQLSKVCEFVNVIEQYELKYKSSQIIIFHRIKNAAKSNSYPEKVREVFQNDNKCRAVAFLYKETLTRQVMVEKLKLYELV